jgi:hypothetical protein
LFHDFENKLLEQQIAADFKARKFNLMVEKVRTEFAATSL